MHKRVQSAITPQQAGMLRLRKDAQSSDVRLGEAGLVGVQTQPNLGEEGGIASAKFSITAPDYTNNTQEPKKNLLTTQNQNRPSLGSFTPLG
jgi:hypothetical protein